MKLDSALPTIETVVGMWEIVVNYFGDERNSLLRIEKRENDLSAWLKMSEDSLEGALSVVEDIPMDLPLHRRRLEKTK